MRKIVKLTREDLVEQIRKSIAKNLNEQDYSSDTEISTQPREFQVKDIFGQKYSRYIPNDVIRYMRKNPSLIFQRLYDIYGEEAFTYLEKAKNKRGGSSSSIDEPMMEQVDDEFETNPMMDKLKEVVENDSEFDDSDIEEIFSFTGPKRSFRGSIYIDGIVPESEDKEFDRKVAIKVMEFFAKRTQADQYVGGVGFKQRSLTKPFDTEDF
jgi:hypothetical protein